MSKEAVLPEKTSDFHTLPDSTRVFVLCLNDLHHTEADMHATRYAANECRSLMKGGERYPDLVSQVKLYSLEKQAQYIANGEYWKIRKEAEETYPDPPAPDQTGLEFEACTKVVLKWQEECKQAKQNREQMEDERYRQEIEKASKLSERKRIEACATIGFNVEFMRVYYERLVLETLYRAVRLEENQYKRYFPCVEAVEDAKKDVREPLWKLYKTLDVDAQEIPI